MIPLLDEAPWRMVRRRWALGRGAPKRSALVMDSTVVVRHGLKRAGAERGHTPKKRGRPSHHPLPAFVRETGDRLGVRWRPGGAHTAGGAAEWLGELAARPRGAGVEDVTVRPGKGFFSRKMARTLEELGVSFPLKVPRHHWLRDHQGPWRFSAKGEAVFPGEEPWTATGKLQGARLLSVRTTRPLDTPDTLDLDTYEVIRQAGVLTNIAGIHALTAWRLHDRGAVVERRIEELAQLSAGETAVEPRGRGPPDAAHAARELPLRLLADRPAQAPPPPAVPAPRQADDPRAQDLSPAPSRRTRPPPPPRRPAGPQPRHPAPRARLGLHAKPHPKGRERDPGTPVPATRHHPRLGPPFAHPTPPQSHDATSPAPLPPARHQIRGETGPNAGSGLNPFLSQLPRNFRGPGIFRGVPLLKPNRPDDHISRCPLYLYGLW